MQNKQYLLTSPQGITLTTLSDYYQKTNKKRISTLHSAKILAEILV